MHRCSIFADVFAARVEDSVLMTVPCPSLSNFSLAVSKVLFEVGELLPIYHRAEQRPVGASCRARHKTPEHTSSIG